MNVCVGDPYFDFRTLNNHRAICEPPGFAQLGEGTELLQGSCIGICSSGGQQAICFLIRQPPSDPDNALTNALHLQLTCIIQAGEKTQTRAIYTGD